MRTLSTAEAYLYDLYRTGDGRVVRRRNSMHWKDALAKASRAIEEEVRPYEKEKVVEGHWNFNRDEFSQFLCDSEDSAGARLCYGIVLPHKELLRAMCIGRRWYGDSLEGCTFVQRPRGYYMHNPKVVWSQPLSERPHFGGKKYSEFHSEKDFEDFYHDCTEMGLDKSHRPRPVGAEGLNGPYLRHLPIVLRDTVKRAGLAPTPVDRQRTGVEEEIRHRGALRRFR